MTARIIYSRVLSVLHRSSCGVTHRSPLSRRFTSTTNNEAAIHLMAIRLSPAKRKLLRISGDHSFIYLQSLLTNDMRRLLPVDRLSDVWQLHPELETMRNANALDQPVIYSYLLSAVGKVLADLFVYRTRYRAINGEYILDVDSRLATAMKRLLLGYTLTRRVNVEISSDLDLWAIVPISCFNSRNEKCSSPELVTIDSDDIKLVPDPRVAARQLGYRLLTRLGASKLQDIGRFLKLAKCDASHKQKIYLHEASPLDYAFLRYQLGIAEGAQEILSGFYFPTELNGDLVNAISLSKGLFTSEEKVVKTYSREGIRRRIFPIHFQCSAAEIRRINPAPRTLIRSGSNSKFGELRARCGRTGIAALWVPGLSYHLSARRRGLAFPPLTHHDTGLRIRASVPHWWPKNIDQIQLPIPDYPKSLFNFKQAQEEPIVYSGIAVDTVSSSLQVIAQEG